MNKSSQPINKTSQTRSQMEQIIDAAPVGIARVSLSGDWLSVNSKLCDIFGYTESELINLTFQELTHPDDLEEDLEYVEQTLNGIIPGYSMDKRYIHKSGRYLWGRLSVSLLRDEEDEAEYFVSIIEDITSRKKNENLLRQKNNFIHHAMNASLTGIYIYDVESGLNDYVNNTYTELTGYTLEDLNSMSALEFSELFHEQERQAVYSHMRQLVDSEHDEKIQIEYRFKCKNGEWLWCLSRDSAFERDVAGKVTKFIGTFIDITERKNLELRLLYDAEHDTLTDVFNRQAFNKHLKIELDRAQRYETPLSLIMLDLDRFKNINDNFGHDVGDRVLTEFAKIVSELVRSSDIVTRYGGEEFIIILPQTDLPAAAEFAERIRLQVERHEFSADTALVDKVTVSIGVANYPESAQDLDSLIKCADSAMYEAKQQGRNKVEAF